MQENVIFFTTCLFLLVVLSVAFYLAVKGNVTAKYVIWAWAVFMVAAMPFATQANSISSLAAGLMLLFFLYVLYLTNLRSSQRLEVSHEETRRVLAESNRRIDEERRTIARRLHDEINPNLVLAKQELKRLENLVKGDVKAMAAVQSAISLVADAYSQTRDVIKNTRIEVIDSIGFTAALESLVLHYTDFFDKPTIKLTHSLPRRPELSEDVAVCAYKIIREAIYNAIKHSNANHIQVMVDFNGALNLYSVEIVDDGVGIKAKAPDGNIVGIGLIDMRERARVLGARITIGPAHSSNVARPGTSVSFAFSHPPS